MARGCLSQRGPLGDAPEEHRPGDAAGRLDVVGADGRAAGRRAVVLSADGPCRRIAAQGPGADAAVPHPGHAAPAGGPVGRGDAADSRRYTAAVGVARRESSRSPRRRPHPRPADCRRGRAVGPARSVAAAPYRVAARHTTAGRRVCAAAAARVARTAAGAFGAALGRRAPNPVVGEPAVGLGRLLRVGAVLRRRPGTGIDGCVRGAGLLLHLRGDHAVHIDPGLFDLGVDIARRPGYGVFSSAAPTASSCSPRTP